MKIAVTFEETSQSFSPNFDKTVVLGSGEAGTTFIPSVSADGVISWTNDGGLPNPEPVNIKGRDGYTPQNGVDYNTPVEKERLIADVINALPVYDGEVV